MSDDIQTFAIVAIVIYMVSVEYRVRQNAAGVTLVAETLRDCMRTLAGRKTK